MHKLFITLLLINSGMANSEIFRCLNDQGRVSFQDSVCNGVNTLNTTVLIASPNLIPSIKSPPSTQIKTKLTNEKITLNGNKSYRKQVSQCLKLLKSKATQDYRFVTKYIGAIEQYPKSGMLAWKTPPTFRMSDRTAFQSITWCAGAIAHDAYHSYLFQKHKVEGEPYPPQNTWAGFDAERKCIRYQISVMRKIGGSQSDIAYLDTQDGTHGDINKDGKLNNDDYENVNW